MHSISFFVEFSGCTGSQNQWNFKCDKAIDGIIHSGTGHTNFWSTPIPAWAIFELTEERNMNSLVLMSGVPYNRLLSFKVTLNVDGQWIQLSDLQVKDLLSDILVSTAQIENDGTVTLNSGIDELTLEFTTVTNVQSIRLDVTETDHSLNNYLSLREIIPGFIGKLLHKLIFDIKD